jgi:hypothetical protein
LGEFYPLWSNFAQSIWMAILVLSLASVASKEEEMQTLMLSIVGITLFELIFEARARYLFIYVPFYIILAVRGAGVLKQSMLYGSRQHVMIRRRAGRRGNKDDICCRKE